MEVNLMEYKQLIRQKGYRFNYIAEQIGVSKEFLSMCLNGKRKLPEKRRLMIDKILEGK